MLLWISLLLFLIVLVSKLLIDIADTIGKAQQ